MPAGSTPEVVLITGASSGIGRETALAYARRGASLVLAARSPEALEDTARHCEAAGSGPVEPVPVDIADREQVESLVRRTTDQFGRVDVAILDAAQTAFGRFDDIEPDVFDAVIATNVTGTANTVRALLPVFGEQHDGHLVILSSVLGDAAVPWQAPYIMSKFALSALIRVLRQEEPAPGLRVHGIHPGPVDTPLYPRSPNSTGRQPRVPLPALDPATVARRIVAATERDRHSDDSVGPGNSAMVTLYRLLPRVFDRVIGRALEAAGLFGPSRRPRTGTPSPAPTTPPPPAPGEARVPGPGTAARPA
ncbi:SDR family NAD(P)-dependent oxidoreductase [Actinomycetospora sp. NBC_00405]|uniref:SDR family NAD(P)-dependent oxidoreductase n=1 Tax=Actinomycetospora sp. NBC_00405 TaxID=2975952 RepID=UPI002E1FF9DC